MARKRTLDRRTLRDQSEAAEARERDGDEAEEEVEEEADGDDESGGDDDESPKPKAKKKPAAAKKPSTTKRTRTPKEVRMKAIWVVFDNSSKRVKEFPYPQKAEAEALLAEKTEEKKGTFYLSLVKEPLEA